MPRPARDIAAALQQKGFKRKENDHTFFHLWVAGKKTMIFTKLSHGERELPDSLLSAMARQVKLNRKQFFDLVDCPLSSQNYINLLRTTGHIP
jgi:hypothetical protein